MKWIKEMLRRYTLLSLVMERFEGSEERKESRKTHNSMDFVIR